MKKEKSKIIFGKAYRMIFGLGLLLMTIFLLIFLFSSIKTGQMDFFTFFYHQSSNQSVFLLFASFYVSLLAIGILLSIIYIFTTSTVLTCYHDRIEVTLFLQSKKIIQYTSINKITSEIVYNLMTDRIWEKPRKEYRIHFHNPIFHFTLSYPVDGYFDNIQILYKKDKVNELQSFHTTKKKIKTLLNLIDNQSTIYKPNLPAQQYKSSN